MSDWERLMKGLETGTMQQEQFESPYFIRLQQALRQVLTAGPRDLAVLFRSVLRQEAEQLAGTSPRLKLPKKSGWPERTHLVESGLKIMQEDNDNWWVQAETWLPHWLQDAKKYAPERSLFALEQRQEHVSTAGDPALQKVNRQTYRNRGQRDAVRSILTMPEGSTLVVNLPTGAGKSLCAQLPAVISDDDNSLTIVVVPTTSLAVDQERIMRSYVGHDTAYYGSGGTREAVKAEIRKRILQGTQRVVFCSPESVLQSLQTSLRIAVERGDLRFFIIDEAHIADTWGDEFRPAFQELAGWRKFVLALSPRPFRTILLSATITEPCLDTLETLFGSPGPFRIFSAAQLRPELAFWNQFCPNEIVRQEWVLESIHHLPRPMILYTSSVNDAEQWYAMLRSLNYKRVGLLTGRSSDHERSSLIDSWQKREIDLVVATSAFGMGIDQQEVRTVLHACIPENVDRYYQEVGRGGRDGKATLSLVLYTTNDRKVAEEMNTTRLISIENGFERWQRMFHSKQNIDDQCLLVPTIVSPSVHGERIDMSTKKNQSWNVRTLTLMARAGLLELDWRELPDDFHSPFESSYWRAVRVLDPYHLTKERWNDKIQSYRRDSYLADQKSLKLMYEVLEGTRCVADIFEEMYTVPERTEAWRASVHVAKACGGCAACRREGSPPFRHPPISSPVDWGMGLNVQSSLQKWFSSNSTSLVVYYDQPDGGFESMAPWVERQWIEWLQWLEQQGIRHVLVDDRMKSLIERAIRRLRLFITPWEEASLARMWPQVPTLLVQPPDSEWIPSIRTALRRLSKEEQVRIFLLPVTAKDPNRPERQLKDRLDGLLLSEFFKGVGI